MRGNRAGAERSALAIFLLLIVRRWWRMVRLPGAGHPGTDGILPASHGPDPPLVRPHPGAPPRPRRAARGLRLTRPQARDDARHPGGPGVPRGERGRGARDGEARWRAAG